MAEERGRPFRPWRGYGLVFILITASLVWQAASDSSWDRAGRVVIGAAALLLALRAASLQRRTIALVGIPVAGLAVAAVVTIFAGNDDVSLLASALVNGLLIAGIPVVVGVDMWRTGAVNFHLVMGLLCVYLVIGLFFTLVFRVIARADADQFFAQISNPDPVDFLYFSFVTLTTVGYGDLTASEDLVRMLAVVEALTGQLYLVTIVALAVSHLAPRRAG